MFSKKKDIKKTLFFFLEKKSPLSEVQFFGRWGWGDLPGPDTYHLPGPTPTTYPPPDPYDLHYQGVPP